MSRVVAEAKELIEEESVLIAAAKMAAKISPERPAGSCSTMNLVNTSSAVANPSWAGEAP